MINLAFVCAGLLGVLMFMCLAHERELEREECPHLNCREFGSSYNITICFCPDCGKVDLL